MTTAADFQTNALYPGGEGKCKVGTDDLYPTDPWYVNVSMDDLHKWMWNLEVWDMDLSLAWETQDDDSPTPGTSGGSLDIGGQWHDLIHDFAAGTDGKVLKGEPNQRVCGDFYETNKTTDFPPTTSNETGSGEYLLPSIDFFGLYDDPNPIQFDVEDGNSNIVGNVDILTDGNTDHALNFIFYYSRLLGDGTADVYFDLYYYGYSIDGSAGSEIEVFKNSTEADAEPYWSGTNGEAVSLTILGKTVSAYVKYRNFNSTTTDSLNSFSFTYAITVTTAYTY